MRGERGWHFPHTGHDHGAVLLSLLDGVVPAAPADVVGPRLQDGELEVEVGVEGQQDGQGGQEDVGDEGGDDGGEGAGEAMFLFLVVSLVSCLTSKTHTHIRPKAISRMLPCVAKSRKPSTMRRVRRVPYSRRDSSCSCCVVGRRGMLMLCCCFQTLVAALESR